MWPLQAGIVFLAYCGITVYTGARVLGLVRFFLPSFKAGVFWPPFVLLCYSFIPIYLLGLGKIRLFRGTAMYSLPVLVYFFLALFVFDGIRLLCRLFARPLPFPSAAGTGIALLFAILAMVYGTFHARNIRTARYDISIAKNESGAFSPGSRLRVALVSDLHLGATVGREWTARVVDAVNRTEPDLICIAGDVFDSGVDAVPDLDGPAAELRRLKAPLGVYACPGNHDVDRLSPGEAGGSGLGRIRDFLKKAGIVLLLDEVELVADRFYLAGRGDARPIGLKRERKTAAELALGIDKSRPFIVMDHQPVDFPLLEKAGADLIFSGHTHAGQFFPGNAATSVIFKRAGAVHYGYWRGISAQGVVSSGAGVWGPPIRVGTGSEVVVVDIKFNEIAAETDSNKQR